MKDNKIACPKCLYYDNYQDGNEPPIYCRECGSKNKPFSPKCACGESIESFYYFRDRMIIGGWIISGGLSPMYKHCPKCGRKLKGQLKSYFKSWRT